MKLRAIGLFQPFLIAVGMLLSAQYAAATPTVLLQFGGRDIPINQILGDGKSGRVYRTWTQGIAEGPVESVSITMRRQSGSDATYANLRYGSGNTFEGKREYLRGGGNVTFTWNVGGAAPNGQPLVLNIYDGEAFVQSARVTYLRPERGPSRRPFDPGPPGYDEGYGRDNDERSGYDRRDRNSGGLLSGSQSSEAEERCRRERVRRPRIEIGRVRATGGVFSGKFKVSGSIYGACVQEAGYFEEGRMKEEIHFPLDDRYNRQEFEITGRSGRRGEIRVFTTDGSDDILSIDDELRDSGGAFQ